MNQVNCQLVCYDVRSYNISYLIELRFHMLLVVRKNKNHHDSDFFKYN